MPIWDQIDPLFMLSDSRVKDKLVFIVELARTWTWMDIKFCRRVYICQLSCRI